MVFASIVLLVHHTIHTVLPYHLLDTVYTCVYRMVDDMFE
jgi:hypothetical protein